MKSKLHPFYAIGLPLFLIFVLFTNSAFAQMPNIDTSIIDKTNDMMEKADDLIDKTSDVVDQVDSVVDKAEDVVNQGSSTISSGGCLIATATYGSELAPQVQMLRELRDNYLLQTESGASFMNTFNDFYYSFSPLVADYERENPAFKEMVKITITPMISSLSILNYVDMDSELDVLGYGISLIILNIGMYAGIPAIVLVQIRKKF